MQNNATAPESTTPATSVRTLAELEEVVQTGLRTYREVGAALDEIKSRGLYKETHPTFEAYLKEKWNMSLSYGYRQIAAAKLAAVSPMGEKLENERQVRKILAETRAKAKQPVEVSVKQPAEVSAKQPAKPKLIDSEEELDNFQETVERWERELAAEDYRELLSQIAEYIDTKLGVAV
jgi:hypothetical protein